MAIFGQGGSCFFPPTLGFPAEVAALRSWGVVRLAGFQSRLVGLASGLAVECSSGSTYRRRWPQIRASPKRGKDVRRRGRWARARACTTACPQLKRLQEVRTSVWYSIRHQAHLTSHLLNFSTTGHRTPEKNYMPSAAMDHW